MRTITEMGSVLFREPDQQEVGTTEIGQVTHPIAEILISMTLRTVEAGMGTAEKAEVAAVVQVIGQAGANIPTKIL